MRGFVVAVAVSVGLLLFAGSADAQWQWKDDKGATKVTQYKLDIPAQYRDGAVWAGPTGVGKPGLSEAQQQRTQREKEIERIGRAMAGNAKYGRGLEKADPVEAQRRCASPAFAAHPFCQGYKAANDADLYKQGRELYKDSR